MTNRCFRTKERDEITLKFIEYSNCKEYTLKSDVVEYNGEKLTKPAFGLILSIMTLRELGIVLHFQTKEITIDEIIFPNRGL